MSALNKHLKAGLFFCLLFFSCANVHAQADAKSQSSKVNYGIQFRSGPSFRKYANELPVSEYTGFNLGADVLSMRYDLDLAARLNSKWTLFAGLGYSSRNYLGTYYCHVCDFMMFPFGSERLEFKYLDVPIFARYRVVDRKLGWHVEFGAETSFALNKVDSRYESDLRLNPYSVNAFVGTGLDYNLNNSINFNATCSYRKLLYSNTAYTFQALEVKAGIIYYFKQL